MDSWDVSEEAAAHKLQEHWPSGLCSEFDCKHNSPPCFLLVVNSFSDIPWLPKAGNILPGLVWWWCDHTSQSVMSVIQLNSCQLLQTFIVAANNKTTEVSIVFNWALAHVAKITLLLRNLSADGSYLWLPQETVPVRLFNKAGLWSKIDYLSLTED